MTDTDTEIAEVARNLIAPITQPGCPPKINVTPRGVFVDVDPVDQGRVIGKHGRTIWAISTVFTAACLKITGHQIQFRLNDPKQRAAAVQYPFKPNVNWNRAAVSILMDAFAKCFSSFSYEIEEEDGNHATVVMCPTDADASFCKAEDLLEAMEILVRASGMANGAVLTSKFK